jgi:hypothetical protein
MQAVAHSKEFADKVEVPQSVGREFYEADKRKKRKGAVERAFKKVRGS